MIPEYADLTVNRYLSRPNEDRIKRFFKTDKHLVPWRNDTTKITPFNKKRKKKRKNQLNCWNVVCQSENSLNSNSTSFFISDQSTEYYDISSTSSWNQHYSITTLSRDRISILYDFVDNFDQSPDYPIEKYVDRITDEIEHFFDDESISVEVFYKVSDGTKQSFPWASGKSIIDKYRQQMKKSNHRNFNTYESQLIEGRIPWRMVGILLEPENTSLLNI